MASLPPYNVVGKFPCSAHVENALITAVVRVFRIERLDAVESVCK
jgi:hypothetical protein